MAAEDVTARHDPHPSRLSHEVIAAIVAALVTAVAGTLIAKVEKASWVAILAIAIAVVAVGLGTWSYVTGRRMAKVGGGPSPASATPVPAITEYQQWRRELSEVIFSVLWQRDSPTTPIQPLDLANATAERAPSVAGYRSPEQLVRAVEEIRQLKLLPTLQRDATGFYLSDDDFVLNQTLGMTAKLEIAAAAATYVRDGMSVALDGGTTTLEVARAIARKFITQSTERLRITSASLQICAELLEIPECREAIRHGKLEIWSMEGPLHATCWTMDPPPDASMPWPLDLAIVGANGITRDGFYMPTNRGAEVKRAFIRTAERALIVADSSKVGRPLAELFSEWTDKICLITNRPSERAARRLLAALPKRRVVYSDDVLDEAARAAVRQEERWAASRGS